LNSSTDISPETHLFAVFDGHAGGKCSKMISMEFPDTLCKDAAFKSKLPIALRNTFQKTNEQFLKIAERLRLNDGSTGVVCVLRGKSLIIGNVGDSRAILISGKKPIQLSTDHKPSLPEEMRRIASFGGTVINCMGVPRVNGILAVARAFGNYNIRHVIKADPDIFQREITSDDDFLILASDGLVLNS
jgi:protein phosphatase 1L